MKGFNIRLAGSGEELIHHECESRLEGDWIVFTCELCPGHERRLNWRTGRMSTTGATPHGVTHSGLHLPTHSLLN
jgi:hypothetical protein